MADNEEAAGRPGFQPSHPGRILRSSLESLGIPKAQLAAHLGVSRQTLYKVLNEQRSLSPDIAARLGRAFGNSARFWLNLQTAHDAWEAEHQAELQHITRLQSAIAVDARASAVRRSAR